MKSFIRKAVVGTLMVAGAVSAQAATLASGSLLAGTTSITFQALSSGTKMFAVSLFDGPTQFAPLDLDLYLGASPVACTLVPTAGGLLLTGASIVSGQTYTLSFSTLANAGSFTATTSLASFSTPSITSVPEAGVLAMALAGVGVLGLMGRRRMA
jgi:hypothetical protein